VTPGGSAPLAGSVGSLGFGPGRRSPFSWSTSFDGVASQNDSTSSRATGVKESSGRARRPPIATATSWQTWATLQLACARVGAVFGMLTISGIAVAREPAGWAFAPAILPTPGSVVFFLSGLR